MAAIKPNLDELADGAGSGSRLPWPAYDGTRIRLQQSETGVRVSIPIKIGGLELIAGLPSGAAARERTVSTLSLLFLL